MRNLSLEIVILALTYIDAHDRDTWLKVGNALKTEFGEIAFAAFDNWSQSADNYDAKAVKSVWKGYTLGKNRMGTIRYHAKQNGFDITKHESKPINPQEQAERQAKREQAELEAEALEQAEKAAYMQLLPQIGQAANAELSTPFTLTKGISTTKTSSINSNELHAFKHPFNQHNGKPESIGYALKGLVTLVPFLDFKTGELVKLQGISGIKATTGKEAGKYIKRFIGKGDGYYWRGDILKQDTPKVIVEGFSDAQTIHEYTKQHHASLAAGNDTALMKTALALRALCPSAVIIIFGDNDLNGKGQRLAEAAAIAINGIFLLPPSKYKDVNEWVLAEGAEGLNKMIEAAIDSKKAAPSSEEDAAQTTETSEPIINSDTRKKQSFAYGGGFFEVSKKGVFYIDDEKKYHFICSSLWVTAKTRTGQGEAWGRLLEWLDDDENLHQWAMPLELLEGDCADVRRELAHKGVSIEPSKRGRDLLAIYLKKSPTEDRALCVERLGWYGDSYILAKKVIGTSKDIIVFQNPHGIETAFSQSGTVEQWRVNVSRFAIGNTRFVFTLSFSFGAPLFELSNAESGGIHLLGDSSIGKSTFLDAACSEWGKPLNYKREWRNTANAIEGLCALHNNGLMVLDEINQADIKTLGQAIYMIVNGQSKGRMNKSLVVRSVSRWNTAFLSAGEKTLETLMKESGQTINAGQAVRLANVRARVGQYGAFEQLHGIESGDALSKLIKSNANKYYGTVGIAWLEYVTANKEGVTRELDSRIKAWLKDNVPHGASGQVSRVASRFALIAASGELATEQGLTGWTIGEANKSAKVCFDDWLLSFGGISNHEDRAILAYVRAFFEAHGSSRFEALEQMSGDKIEKVMNRVGYWKQDDTGKYFLVFQESFKNEICKGYDHKQVVRILRDANVLIKDKEGNSTTPTRTPDNPKLTRLYVINANILFSTCNSRTTCTDTDFKQEFTVTGTESGPVQPVTAPVQPTSDDVVTESCYSLYRSDIDACTDKKANKINGCTPRTPCTPEKQDIAKNPENLGFSLDDEMELFDLGGLE
ncbi:MAG: DUF927 domain-containing protein [Agitococcus sp.]|nr:DUF927 domain-containing protein [Agitococcus sp.]